MTQGQIELEGGTLNLLCHCDISGLCRFVTTYEQDDHGAITHGEIKPVASAYIRTHFGNAFADRLYVAKIASGRTINTSCYGDLCFKVA